MKVLTVTTLFCALPLSAQIPAAAPSDSTISVRSNVVLVPAMVKTKAGGIVYSLSAKDFVVTDDGILQKLTLEPDTDSQPLAVVVVVETGGSGVRHLKDYGRLGTILETVVGNVPHRVAVVSFDSAPRLAQDFISDVAMAASVIGTLQPGDGQAAILDSLGFAVDLLRKQPSEYRRAILLISETIDDGSHLKLDQALRAISDNNTAIYSVAFSSSRAAINRQASQTISGEPGPAGGCMSNAPDAAPDANGSRAVQAWDCLTVLAPPLRLVRMLEIAARDSMRRNVPESVAKLTGGEYFAFKDTASLQRSLLKISNDVPNRYILSFQSQSPHPGLHAIGLTLKDRPDLVVESRSSYWVEGDPSALPQP
jgi:VWFA-related protein